MSEKIKIVNDLKSLKVDETVDGREGFFQTIKRILETKLGKKSLALIALMLYAAPASALTKKDVTKVENIHLTQDINNARPRRLEKNRTQNKEQIIENSDQGKQEFEKPLNYESNKIKVEKESLEARKYFSELLKRKEIVGKEVIKKCFEFQTSSLDYNLDILTFHRQWLPLSLRYLVDSGEIKLSVKWFRQGEKVVSKSNLTIADRMLIGQNKYPYDQVNYYLADSAGVETEIAVKKIFSDEKVTFDVNVDIRGSELQNDRVDNLAPEQGEQKELTPEVLKQQLEDFLLTNLAMGKITDYSLNHIAPNHYFQLYIEFIDGAQRNFKLNYTSFGLELVVEGEEAKKGFGMVWGASFNNYGAKDLQQYLQQVIDKHVEEEVSPDKEMTVADIQEKIVALIKEGFRGVKVSEVLVNDDNNEGSVNLTNGISIIISNTDLGQTIIEFKEESSGRTISSLSLLSTINRADEQGRLMTLQSILESVREVLFSANGDASIVFTQP